MEHTWAVASYILGAFCIYGGVSGLLFKTMTFGVENGEQCSFSVSGRRAQLIGLLSLIVGGVVLLNFVLGLICMVALSVLASILKD